MIKILTIDDNRYNLVSLKAVLNDYFPASIVLTATSGLEGIALANSEDPDVILLDILMPEMDGYAVCRALKKDQRLHDIPIVFLTATKENKESRIQAIRAGAEAFLFKPIDETELITQINAMVKIKAANRAAQLEKQRLNTLVNQRTKELQNNQVAMLNLLEDLRKENEARAKTEAALRSLSARNQAILDSVPDIIMEVDNKKVYTWANTTGKNFFGDDVIGRQADYFFEGEQDTYNIVSPLFNGSAYDVLYVESWQRRMDGQKRLLAWWCKTLRDGVGNIIGALSVAQDITERKRAEEKLRNYNEQLRNYAAHNDKVREQERINLARDIHDIFGSSLAGLKMELTILRNEIMHDGNEITPEIESQLKDMMNQVDDSVGLMRRIVSDLRPGILDQLGLEDAIKVHSSEAEKRSGITFRVESSLKSMLKIKSEQAIIIFRIFQEIISNIIRHSGAKTGNIYLQTNKNIFILEVIDDGRGISDAELKRTDSFGIMGMKERALLVDGKLHIKGETNRGTKVLLEVPVK